MVRRVAWVACNCISSISAVGPATAEFNGRPLTAPQVDRSKGPVDPSEVRQFGLVLSCFEYNGNSNPNCRCGLRL